MSAISLEFGALKIVLLIFSLLFLFLGLHPFILPYLPKLRIITPDYRNYILIVLAAVQTAYVTKMRRPRVY